jgi:hypothetical protein
MGRPTLSSTAYEKVYKEAKASGSTTSKGEQRHKEGHGLHELVDPKGFGVIRRALTWYEPKDLLFTLLRGVAMLEETRLDTTGSMGRNVDVAMEVLPKTYDLLKKIPNAVLGRYDVQMITSIFGDVVDDYVLCRSQAEMDERIAEQLTLMVPEGGGGDSDEDPQYGIFGGAYLTQADINLYGLKYYDFTVTDARGRQKLSSETLKRVFGETVFEKVKENGFKVKENALPNLTQIVKDLLNNAHAFVLLVGGNSGVRSFWEGVYSKERVITLPRTELLPEVKAAIIGLTEGTLTLDTLEDFLIKEAKCSKEDAKSIKRAVAGIPIGAQMEAENFDKIPLAGTLFKEKRDLWPMDESEVIEEKVTTKKSEEKGKEKMWA